MGSAAKRDEIGAMIEERVMSGELHLPPLPDIAQRVLAATSDEGASAETLAALVHRDAGLASELLRYANAALLGARVRIVSIQQAISRLGIRRVSEIAIASSLRTDVASCAAYPQLSRTLWRRSLATALFAREVTRTLRRNVEVAFLCGLLRGIGRSLVLDTLSRLPGIESPDEDSAEALCERLGHMVGQAAVARWSLPAELCVAFGAPDDEGARPLQGALGLAERLADYACLARGDEDALLRCDELRELNLYPEDAAGLLERVPQVRDEIEAWS